MIDELLYLTSNIILTLYGVLIKSVTGSNISDQILFRAVAFILITIFGNRLINPFTIETIALSTANFLSIWGIYYGFQKMPISFAQTIFYTWPVFYYIISGSFNIYRMGILITIFGLIYGLNNSTNQLTQFNSNNLLPILAVLISVATHIGIFSYFKNYSNDTISKYLYKQYFWILIGLILYFAIQMKNPIGPNTKYIILFNLILGYLGFYLQFRGVRILNNYSIAILSFLAISLSFFLDKWVYGTDINIVQILMIIIIILISSYYKR